MTSFVVEPCSVFGVSWGHTESMTIKEKYKCSLKHMWWDFRSIFFVFMLVVKKTFILFSKKSLISWLDNSW